MSTIHTVPTGTRSTSTAAIAPRATVYAGVALAFTCAAFALSPPGDPAGVAQCVCAALAVSMGIAADRTSRRIPAAVWELLACVALLACASAAVTQLLLVEPELVRVSWAGLTSVSGAITFAASLFGTSRALQRLGMGVTP